MSVRALYLTSYTQAAPANPTPFVHSVVWLRKSSTVPPCAGGSSTAQIPAELIAHCCSSPPAALQHPCMVAPAQLCSISGSSVLCGCAGRASALWFGCGCATTGCVGVLTWAHSAPPGSYRSASMSTRDCTQRSVGAQPCWTQAGVGHPEGEMHSRQG